MADGKTLWVILAADATAYRRDFHAAGDETDRFGNKVDNAQRKTGVFSNEINKMSGRIRLVVDSLLLIGPATIPIGAMAIPAVAGLASQLGFAALAGGSLIASFQGVGTALQAVNKAQLEPTAANLEAARIAMQNLSPQARQLVHELRDFVPVLKGIRDAGAAGAFPGIAELLDDLERAAPRLESVVNVLATATGGVAEELGEGIAGPRTAEFLRFVEQEAPQAIGDTAAVVSNLVAGLAELWMAFAPVNRDFLTWLRESTEGFDEWASGLSETQGFEDFLSYIDENGPRVAEALGAIGNMLLQIIQAAAPLGGPTLMALEAVADVIATIADSDAGPAIMATVTALTLLSRTTKTLQAVNTSQWFNRTKDSITGMTGAIRVADSAQDRAMRGTAAFAAAEEKRTKAVRGGLATIGRGAAAAGGLAIAYSGAADKIGLTNTVSLALMGTMAGPWGAAIGGAIGLVLDFASGQKKGAEASADLASTLDHQTQAVTDNTRAVMAQRLADEGAIEDARTLGLSLTDLVDYTLGYGDSVERVNAILDDNDQKLGQSTSGQSRMTAAEVEASYAAQRLTEVLTGQKGTMEATQAEAREVAIATGGMTTNWTRAHGAAQELRAELIRLNAQLEERATIRDYEAALDDFAATLNDVKNKARLLNKDGTINIDVRAGRDVEAALDNIASSAIAVAENLKGTQKIQVLNRARADIRDAAEKLGMNREQIRALLIDMGLLDRKRSKPKVDLQAGSAASILGNIDRQLDSIDGRVVTTTVKVVQTGGGKYFKDVPAGADGMTVPGPRVPYGDRTLVLAAPGEEIISNRYGEADQFRADRAAGRIPRYAGGGTVDRRMSDYVTGAASTVYLPASLPDKLELVVGGQRFTAYVRSHAAAVVARRDRTQQDADDTATRMEGPL